LAIDITGWDKWIGKEFCEIFILVHAVQDTMMMQGDCAGKSSRDKTSII